MGSCPQTARPSHIKETRMAKPDPYADIDFEEITDATGLAVDEIKCLKVCFDLFDTKKQDFLSADELGEFCQLCATFLVEDPDMETMKRELKDTFRIYDKEGLGYITPDTLRGLISEL